MAHDDASDQTGQLLQRVRSGDRTALEALLERDLEWIRRQARGQLADRARRHVDTGDLVQEVITRLLTYGPPFHVESRERFRAVLVHIVRNTMRSMYARHRAQKRDDRRERSAATDSVLYLDGDGPVREATRPDDRATRNEQEQWVRFALELLDGPEQDVVVLRDWDGLAFKEIGARLAITEDAARMRYKRAVNRLARIVLLARAGRIDDALRQAGAS